MPDYISTGFKALDKIISGFYPADLILVGGRPSMGKTAFCLGLVRHIAIKENIPVAIFSLEMPKEQLIQRILCSEVKLNLLTVMNSNIGRHDWPELTNAATML